MCKGFYLPHGMCNAFYMPHGMCNGERVKLGVTGIWTLAQKLQAQHLTNWATEPHRTWRYKMTLSKSVMGLGISSWPREHPSGVPLDPSGYALGVSGDSFGILPLSLVNPFTHFHPLDNVPLSNTLNSIQSGLLSWTIKWRISEYFQPG